MKELKKNMKTIFIVLIIAGILIILLARLISFYYSDEDDQYLVTMKPEVNVTNNTYNFSIVYHTFQETAVYGKFEQEYGPIYSEKLRNNIILNIKERANNLGENATELEECLRATGRLDETNIEIIPCLAEKAKFEYYSDYRGTGFYVSGYGLSDYWRYSFTTNETSTSSEDCWIFVFNWGSKNEDFGHVKIYAVATSDYSVLCYMTCT